MFDVRYDSANNGTYNVDLGTCTTNVSGTCSPPANDGTEYLPGNYEAIEQKAPAWLLPADAPAHCDVHARTCRWRHSCRSRTTCSCRVSFHKVPTGNYNPQTVILAGRRDQRHLGLHPRRRGGDDLHHRQVAATARPPSVLISGQPYCWVEVTAPPGLVAGANGCFTADNSTGVPTHHRHRPRESRATTLTKVDAQSPSTRLAGAIYDLYRVDNGQGPPGQRPTPPGRRGASQVRPGWPRRPRTANGVATFPLQFPGYSYCYLEVEPPPNYVLNTTRCARRDWSRASRQRPQPQPTSR